MSSKVQHDLTDSRVDWSRLAIMAVTCRDSTTLSIGQWLSLFLVRKFFWIDRRRAGVAARDGHRQKKTYNSWSFWGPALWPHGESELISKRSQVLHQLGHGKTSGAFHTVPVSFLFLIPKASWNTLAFESALSGVPGFLERAKWRPRKSSSKQRKKWRCNQIISDIYIYIYMELA